MTKIILVIVLAALCLSVLATEGVTKPKEVKKPKFECRGTFSIVNKRTGKVMALDCDDKFVVVEKSLVQLDQFWEISSICVDDITLYHFRNKKNNKLLQVEKDKEDECAKLMVCDLKSGKTTEFRLSSADCDFVRIFNDCTRLFLEVRDCKDCRKDGAFVTQEKKQISGERCIGQQWAFVQFSCECECEEDE